VTDNPIDDMVESLKAFSECKHKHWECTHCHCRTDAGTIAAPWRTRVNELEQRVAELTEQLRQQNKSFCTHCGKLFPKGVEGLAKFRKHIAECNKHPLHPMQQRIAELEAYIRSIPCSCTGKEPIEQYGGEEYWPRHSTCKRCKALGGGA
jgi:hypothetical protein